MYTCGKKKFVEAASSTFSNSQVCAYSDSYRQNIIHITNGKEVNAVENVSTYAHTQNIHVDRFSTTDHMLIVWA